MEENKTMYHIFRVFDYKGGELCSSVNMSESEFFNTIIEDLFLKIVEDFDKNPDKYLNKIDLINALNNCYQEHLDNDYWICPNCNSLNWYENEECCDNLGINCDRTNSLHDYNPKMVDYEKMLLEQANEMKNDVLEWVKKEIKFYIESFDYNKSDYDNIELNC